MIEEFEYKGIWWLPDKPKKRISGTLRFAPNEGAILDLTGSFKDIRDINKILKSEIILGISSNGKEITLYNCFETKSSFSFPGFPTSSFYADMVFIGAHFQKLENIKFKSISVHYLHLDEWANISGFDIQPPLPDREVVIKYKAPEPIKASINDDYTIHIIIKAKNPTRSVVQKEVSITQKTYIQIKALEEKSFEEYMKVMNHIQNFLSLGVMEPVYPLIIEGTAEVCKTMIKDKPYYPPIKIFYRLTDISTVSKTLLPFNMLFTFRDISDRFEGFLKNWFGKAELLEPVYDLYFGTLFNPRMYLQNQFLSLVQAIESYHRRIMKNYESPEEEHDKRIEEILNTIPEKNKEWLKSRLEYSNEPTLRSRLREIFDEYPEIVNNLIEDKGAFIHKVVVTRNYLTHYDSSLRDQAAEREELYHITQKLKILLEVCLLAQLGFSFDDIKSLISRNKRYQHESIQ